MDHPIVRNMERTGSPDGVPFATTPDYFDRDIQKGDEILILDDDTFLLEELDDDAIKILRDWGAYKDIAE